MKYPLTPAQRAALKLKIGLEMEGNPDFAERVLMDQKKRKTKKKLIKIGRWIAVIPAAFVGYALTNLMSNGIYHLLSLVNGYEMWVKFILVDFLGPGYAGYVFVLTGILVSPSFNKETCIILTVLLSITLGISIFLSLFMTGNYNDSIAGLAGIVGAIYGCLKYLKTEGITEYQN